MSNELPEWLSLFGDIPGFNHERLKEKMVDTRDNRSPRQREADRIASELVKRLREASDNQEFASPQLVRHVSEDISRFLEKYVVAAEWMESALDGLCAPNHDPSLRAFARKCLLTGMGEVRYAVDRLCDEADAS